MAGKTIFDFEPTICLSKAIVQVRVLLKTKTI